MATKLSDDERAAIVEAIRAGKSRNDIVRESGRSAGAVTRIAKAEGLGFDREATKHATEAQRADNAARRQRLIAAMYKNAERLNLQMFAPAVERKPMNVSMGRELGSEVQIVDVHLEQPTFSDKRNIAVATKVLIDGARQLELVDESGQEEAKGMLARLVDGCRDEAT